MYNRNKKHTNNQHRMCLFLDWLIEHEDWRHRPFFLQPTPLPSFWELRSWEAMEGLPEDYKIWSSSTLFCVASLHALILGGISFRMICLFFDEKKCAHKNQSMFLVGYGFSSLLTQNPLIEKTWAAADEIGTSAMFRLRRPYHTLPLGQFRECIPKSEVFLLVVQQCSITCYKVCLNNENRQKSVLISTISCFHWNEGWQRFRSME